MGPSIFRACGWTLLGLALYVPAAIGQVGRGAGINRPSAQGPSSWDNRLGGYYTRLNLTRPETDIEVATSAQALGLPSRPRSVTDTNSAVRLGPVTPFNAGLPNMGMRIPSGRIGFGQLRGISGFSMATSMGTPLLGWDFAADIPESTTPIVPPVIEGNRFQQAFGLKPAPAPLSPSAAPVSYDDINKALDREADATVARSSEKALALFRDATTRNVPTEEQLRTLHQAVTLLEGLRRIERAPFLSDMLLAHAALADGHVASAIYYLTCAARADASGFRDGPKLAPCFGDYDERTARSAYLDAQARATLQVLGTTTTVEGAMLEAYCSRVLGDQSRAAAALDKAQNLLLQSPARVNDADKLMNALRFAL